MSYVKSQEYLRLGGLGLAFQVLQLTAQRAQLHACEP